MAFTFVTVTARFETLSGASATGKVVLTPTSAMSNSGQTVSTVPVTLTLTAGQAVFQAAANDDPLTTPTGVSYTVSELIDGATPRTYNIVLTHAVTTVNLSDLAPALNANVFVTYQLVSMKDQPNGYPSLDVSGHLNSAVIPWVLFDARYDASGVAAAAVASHASATDPHGDRADAATKYLPKTDASVTNARTPTAHASSHATGGFDPIPPASIGALTQTVADGRYDAIGAATAALTAAQASSAQIDSTTGQVSPSQTPSVAMPPTIRRPRYVQPTNILTQMQSGHGFTQQGTGTYVANDTADFIIPSQSCKITTDGAQGAAKVRKAGMTAVDTTAKMLRLRVKIDDITHLKNFEVFYGSSSFASYYMWIVQGTTGGSNFIPSGGAAGAGAGWYNVTLHFADATITGTPSRSSLTDLQFLAQDDGGGTVTLHIQDAALIPDASAIFPNGVVSIGFDDDYSSIYTYGFPKLQQYGYPASLYLIQSLVGTTGRLTMAQINELQDLYGWEIGSHAYLDADHALTYTGMTFAALVEDLRKMKAWEITNGIRGCDGTAYPLGQYGLTTDGKSTTDAVKQFNAYARTVTRKNYETFPPADPYRLRAQSAVSTFTGGYSPSSITATNGDLDKIKANQLWGIYTFHEIVTGAPSATTQIAQSDFNNIIDGLASRGIPVIPAGDVLRHFG